MVYVTFSIDSNSAFFEKIASKINFAADAADLPGISAADFCSGFFLPRIFLPRTFAADFLLRSFLQRIFDVHFSCSGFFCCGFLLQSVLRVLNNFESVNNEYMFRLNSYK